MPPTVVGAGGGGCSAVISGDVWPRRRRIRHMTSETNAPWVGRRSLSGGTTAPLINLRSARETPALSTDTFFKNYLSLDDPNSQRAITDYLFIADRMNRSDVAIVFGMSRWQRPLARALDLYRNGTVRRLIFTGGYNPNIAAVEAQCMARAALDCGVPADHFGVEAEATNTLENVVFAARHLEGAGSAILVAIHFHARRALLTAAAHLPRSVALGIATYPSLFYDQTNWHVSERGRSDVRVELGKLGDATPTIFERCSGTSSSNRRVKVHEYRRAEAGTRRAGRNRPRRPAGSRPASMSGLASALLRSVEALPSGRFVFHRSGDGTLWSPCRKCLRKRGRSWAG